MSPSGANHSPTFIEENRLYARGVKLVAGIDEAGRGALAGSVVAAAVILPPEITASWLGEIRDSKQLPPSAREYYYDFIKEAAVAIGVGIYDNVAVDGHGILAATRMAMKQAIGKLSPAPEYLLIDYLELRDVPIPQKGITFGDSLCVSIACASIVAKVSRDRMMRALEEQYPGYGFTRNKGYGTQEHLAGLRRLGPCRVHRRSFRPVKTCLPEAHEQ
ncbi:ribonuclease HII [Chloroflexota bacterium]